MIVAYAATEAVLRRGAVIALALTLCACAHEKAKPIEENTFPADYRAQVADRVRLQFNSGNIRDAYIAEPVLKTFLPTPRFVACLRLSGADGVGARRETKVYAAYFYAGRITQIVDATVEQCDKAAFLPFLELQAPHAAPSG